jgi:hypothetical protein
MRIFNKNEKGWMDEGHSIELWRKEVEDWEENPQKWLTGDANPYRRRGRGK